MNARIVHVFGRPGAEGYAEHVELTFGEPLAVPGTDRTIALD